MTSEEALKVLKAKLTALVNAEEGTVALAGTIAKKASYVFTDVSVDWDPTDHPRDPNTGEFVKSPTGYIFGLAKTATFGVSGMAKKIDLKPGDVAFKTPAGNVVVSHADGSFSLHHGNSVDLIPAGNESAVAANVMEGKYTKIGENPGTVIPASTVEDAKAKVEDPASFQKADSKATKSGIKVVPTPPALKPGKDKYTAKQYADYQSEAKGALLGHDKEGNPVLSGSWIEYNGKPHLIHASPYGGGGVTAYKWVATKQQASNLAREDILTVKGLSEAKVIEDPTGKPYGKPEIHPNSLAVKQAVEGGLKHGSLMSQAVTGPIPNTATAHKKHVEAKSGTIIEVPHSEGVTMGASDKNGTLLKSGDWVELEGKPFQVHSSPNAGNIALGKWVSTKQQASNNTYDFPAAVLSNAVKIDDPSGKTYVPLKQQAADTKAASAPSEAEIADAHKTLMDALTQGEIAPDDLHPVVDHGSDAAKVAAQQILDDISQNEILNPPAPEPLAEWEKALLGQPHKVSSLDLATIASFEVGTILRADSESEQTYLLKQPAGQWLLMDGSAEGEWQKISSEEAQTILTINDQTVTAIPPGDPLSQEIQSNPMLKPWTKKVFSEGSAYFLRDGEWYSNEGVPQLSDSSDYLNELWDTQQALAKEIADAKAGDEIHFVRKDTGKVTAFRVEKDGSWFNLSTNKKSSYPKDHYVSKYVLGGGGSQNYEVKVMASEESTADLPPKGQQFVHPVSGVVFSLEPGDKVYKHKTTDNGYIVVKGSGDKPVNFFTATGKQQQPKESQKNLAKSYVEITDWPGKVKDKAEPVTPASGVTEQMVAAAQPEDSIYIYDGPNYYAHYKKLNFGGWEKQGGQAVVTQLKDQGMKSLVTSSDAKWSFQFYPKGSSPQVSGEVPATPELIKSAAPGDSIVLTSESGDPNFPVVKQENGDWMDQTSDLKWSEEVIASQVQTAKFTFIPAPASPWGSKDAAGTPQMDPEPVSTKPAPKTKGKKAPELPKTVTLPDGTKLDLKPGEIFGKTKSYGVDYYVHIGAGKGNNKVYNADGSQGYWGDVFKWTPASLKNYIKKNGGEVLGENIPPTDKIDFSQYEASDLPENHYSIQTYVIGVRDQFPIATSYYGGIYGYKSYPEYDDKSWNDLESQQRLEIIASYEQLAGQAVASLQPVAKMEGLDKAEKQAFGKSRTAFEFMHRVALVARELNNPDTTWDDDKFDAEISFIGSKAAKPGLTVGGLLKGKYPIDEIHSVLFSANTQRKFKNSLTSLDFDPYNGTTEEYDAYAKSKGFSHLAALDADMQKLWVLSDLGDPTLSLAKKNQAKTAATKAQTKVAVVGLAQAIAKTHEDPIPEPSGIKGVYDKASLKASYSWSNSEGPVEIKNVGPDEWVLKHPKGTDSPGNDATVSVIINGLTENGTEFTASDEFAYGPTDVNAAMEKLQEKFGQKFNQISSWDELATFIASLGGNLKTADPAFIKPWLLAHAKGDEVAKFYIERKSHGGSHPKGENHLGSPTNHIGLAAHKALADLLATSPVGQSYLAGNGLSAAERTELGDLVGFDANGNKTGNIASIGIFDNFTLWEDTHPYAALALHGSGAAGKSKALKPNNVPDEVWAAVNAVEESTDLTSLIPSDAGLAQMSDQELTSALSANGTAKNAGLISPLLGGIPPHMKRLALWGATDDTGDNYRDGFLYAIAAKAKAGEYLDESTPAWISPDGSKYPISPGASVYHVTGDYYGDYYVVTGPPSPDGTPSTDGWQFKEDGQAPQKMSISATKQLTSGQTGKKVFTMPGAVQFDQAQKDIPDLLQTYWDESVAIEEGKSKVYTYPESGAILTAALKNNLTLEQDYPHLYAQHKSLPENVRQAVMAALTGPYASPKILELLEYKAAKGHYASLGSKGLFDSSQPWLIHLSKGQTSEEHVLNSWSADATEAYVKHFGLGDWGSIASHLDSVLNPQTLTISKALPKFEDLQLTPTGKSLGGMHSKQVLVDQDGNEWMSKAFNSDPNSKARVDAETGAVRIGRLYGFRTPIANTQAVPGHKYAYLQHLAPAVGDLSGKGPKDLTQKQLQQAMEEHLLDWIVANHDTHSQNLMLSPNGEVFGIDKGQAFKHFPKDKLAVGYLPPENGAPVWYDQFYNGVINGQISKEMADEVTKHVLRRAQKISKDLDAEFRAELEKALQHRDFWPDQYPTRDQFIDGLVERKHNAFDDFVSFYKSVYEKSAYEWTIDTENLVPPMLDDHTHISATQDFAEDVKKAGVHGKAIFFHSADLEDSHIITSTAKDKDGTVVLTGEAKIRKDGDTALTNWLSKQTIIGGTVQQQPQSYYDDYLSGGPAQINPSELPGNAEWFSAMVAGSKTVSSHNASGDHAYNEGTLSSMTAAASQVGEALTKLEEWKNEHPDTPFSGMIASAGNQSQVKVELHTLEQQAAWEEMLNTYAGYAQKVIDHKGTDQKISPHFKQISYDASADAIAAVQAKQSAGKTMTAFHPSQAADILKDAKNGDIITYVNANGAQTLTKEYGGWKGSSTGNMVSSEQIEAILSTDEEVTDWHYSGFVPEYVEPEPEETSTTVTVGTKVLKVIKKPNAMKNGSYDFETGDLKLTGGEATKFQKGFQLHGNMYEIDFGNTVIEYRPHGDGIPLTQQGLLRFHKKDWTGDSESIEEIFDVLRQMGLALDPATETSMELFYWKHQYGILQNRVDRTDPKWSKVISAIQTGLKQGMTPEEELKVFREAWASALGQDVVDHADWMPKFSRQRTFAQGEGEFTTGHPYWHRADYTIEDIHKWMGDHLPATSLTYGGNADDAVPVALSGSMLSAEERARYYGSVAKGGASSDSDQGYGSSGQVYIKPKVYGHDHEVYYHPRILLRTHNYAFPGDHYGKIADQKQYAYFDGKQATEMQGELMVKHAVSVMDDIIMIKFPNDLSRQKAIKAYKDAGVTTLHGLPIEEIFVTSTNGLSKVREHVYAEAIKAEQGEKKNVA